MTLIPKTVDKGELKDANNWRPITIGSTLLRLFTKILHERLQLACPITPRQKGFIKAEGCAENVVVLNCLIRQHKVNKKPLGVVLIDFAKAFDSVDKNLL